MHTSYLHNRSRSRPFSAYGSSSTPSSLSLAGFGGSTLYRGGRARSLRSESATPFSSSSSSGGPSLGGPSQFRHDSRDTRSRFVYSSDISKSRSSKGTYSSKNGRSSSITNGSTSYQSTTGYDDDEPVGLNDQDETWVTGANFLIIIF